MFLMLLVFWLIFNGKVTAEIFLVGVAVSAALTFMWCKVFQIKQSVFMPSLEMIWRYLKYFGSLFLEIIHCNIQVMRLILHPQEEVHPQLITFPIKLKKDSHKVALANSITLTPGTITVAMQDDSIRVHGLDASFLEGIEDSDMMKRLEKMEEGLENV